MSNHRASLSIDLASNHRAAQHFIGKATELEASMGDVSSIPAESPSVLLPTSWASSVMPAPGDGSSQREGSVVSYATGPDIEDARSDTTERAVRAPLIPLIAYHLS